MDDATFERLVESATRGEMLTDVGMTADEEVALAVIARSAPTFTDAHIADAWAAHRGESPFDSRPIAELFG